MGMAGQTKIQQHGAAVIAKQHVGRFQVQMHRVLLVQCVGRTGHGCAQARNVGHTGARIRVKPMLQRLAMHIFHDQVGHAIKITSGHEAWHMRAGEHLHDLAFDLEAHDVFGSIAGGHAWHLHRHGEAHAETTIGVMHLVDVRHAARVDALVDGKPVERGSWFK